MSVTFRIFSGIGVISIAMLIGLFRFKQLDIASRIIVGILMLDVINEVAAYFFAKKYHNNMPVYNINNIVELALIAFYFNAANRSLKRRNIGIWIGLFSIVFGLINFIFLQSILVFSVSFLLFEGFCIIVLSLLAFYRFLLIHEDLQLYRFPHFWFASIFLFFWSITYLYWGLYPIVGAKISGMYIWLANIISFSAIALVFLFYPKMKITNE